jgi:hypothetical protein
VKTRFVFKKLIANLQALNLNLKLITMKNLLIFFGLLFFLNPALAQEELHIHHINVEDGDATMVGIYNVATHTYKSSILIDGGASNPNDLLLPYLKKTIGNGIPHFNYIVLTHYHKDHYNGLLALKDGKMTADSIIDPSGYAFGTIFPAQATLQAGEATPGALVLASPWTIALKTAVAHGFVKGHARGFISFGTSSKSCLGHRFTIGTAGGFPVVLECVAGWGNTLNGHGITTDPAPAKNNANDFTLSFVLTCGQFRYFIGGDLGGHTESDYIDQETPLTADLAVEFPVAWSFNHTNSAAGHICGFKANHHGSDHSNAQAFMNAMTPAVTVTSAGKEPQWHLPSPAYLNRLGQVKPLSVWLSSTHQVFSRGVYITNLYDFPNFASRTTATGLFPNQPMTSFGYGNAAAGQKSGYLVKVTAVGLASKSAFQVYQVDNAGATQTLLANFQCHSK